MANHLAFIFIFIAAAVLLHKTQASTGCNSQCGQIPGTGVCQPSGRCLCWLIIAPWRATTPRIIKIQNAAMKKKITTQIQELEGVKNDEMVLVGFTASTTSLPLTFTCNSQLFSHIQVGGITINGIPISTSLQSIAVDECADDPSNKATKNKLTFSCSIWFGPGFTLNSTDTIYAVYQCLESRPTGPVIWGKKKSGLFDVKADVQKSANKEVVLKCNKGLSMISINSVYVNDVHVNHTQFPSLNANLLTASCYNQTIVKIKSGFKGNVKCYIMNKEEYGGTLKIDYICKEPPSFIQEPKVEYETVPIKYKNEVNPTPSINVSTVSVCEHKTAAIECQSPKLIHVQNAVYGRLNNDVCSVNTNQPNWSCNATTSYAVVLNYCQGKASCSVPAENGVFGNPCIGTLKYLEVKTACRQNKAREKLSNVSVDVEKLVEADT
eukprot:gene17404-19147_t